jgi:hypothetical protein
VKLLAEWWCRRWHRRVMYAGGRKYTCRKCGREYAAPHVNERKEAA